MKDFIKWLGVNDKVAKVAVWMLITMICLIVVNTFLRSIGLPNYQVTYENLVKINVDTFLNAIFDIFISLLNFYSIILLVFGIKEAKNIFKYGILYILLNFVIYKLLGYAILQLFIIGYCVTFCYFYSNKNKKYAFYCIISFLLNGLVQTIWYSIKISFIDYETLKGVTKTILSIDYFIIMGIIILVKEIYLKKRGVKKCQTDQDVSYGLVNSKKKETLQRN